MKTALSSRYRLFVTMSLAGSLSFLALAFLRGAPMLDWVAMENNGDWCFADYFMHVAYVADPTHLYSRATGAAGCFPPFAYLLYYALFHMSAQTGLIPADRLEAATQEYALVVFLYYTLTVSLMLLLGVRLWLKDGRRTVGVYSSLMLSVPFLAGGVERGNSTVLVVALLLIALWARERESRTAREVALVLIAVSAAFKLYPAILGLLYLKERRWGEAARLVVYGISFLILPFFAFGGFEALAMWVGNVTSTMAMAGVGRIQYVKGLVITIASFAFNADGDTAGTVFQFVFLAAMVWLAARSTDREHALTFLTLAMALFPTNAYRYTLCYLAIPLVVRLSEEGDTFAGVTDFLYGLLFSVPILWGVATAFRLNFGYYTLTYVELWEYACAYSVLIYTIIAESSIRPRLTSPPAPTGHPR